MLQTKFTDFEKTDSETLNNINRQRRTIYIASTVVFILSITLVFVLAIAIISISNVFNAVFYAGDINLKASDIHADRYLGVPWIIMIPSLVLVPLTLIPSIIKAGEFDNKGNIKLNWFDRIFTEIQVFIGIVSIILLDLSNWLLHTWIYRSHLLDKPISIMLKKISDIDPTNGDVKSFIQDSVYTYDNGEFFFEPHWVQLVVGVLAAFFVFFVDIMIVHSIAKKIKSGSFWKKTFLGSIWLYLYHKANGCEHSFAKVMIMLILITVISATGYGAFVVLIFIFAFVPSEMAKYAALKKGIREVKNGNIEYKIPINGNGEIDKLSEDVNSIANAQEIAVGNKLHNQKMKTELISHVSHDLRTPLTSMISYLDLLKHEGLDSERAPEYLKIITDKTQRLSKLTEDLFEAAKASSGDIPVELTKLEIISLASQAVAEVSDIFIKNNITPVMNTKLENAYVMADGEQLWRVIDNLLTNVSKYSVPGSRAYLDVYDAGSYFALEVKNISSMQLNISPDELMERFQRGDASRNTDGSGLGLTIARDLIKLMQGKFEIKIDGDLFKATVYMKKAE